VPAFFAYAEFERVWQAVPDNATEAFRAAAGPVLTLTQGDADAPGTGAPLHFSAARPADRVSETPHYAVEYLHNPTPQRLNDLQTQAPFDHALLVEIPGQNYREVFGIEAGLTFPVGDTGYTLTIDAVGPYGIPFITEEFTGDQRGDPKPDIRLTYLDNTKPQIRLITRTAGAADPTAAGGTEQSPELSVLLRLPRFAPAFGPLSDGKVPLAIRSETPGAPAPWLHVTGLPASR